MKKKDNAQQKEKKITFSEEIDDKINGFALAIAFIIVGFLLLYDKTYFGNETVSTIIRWIFICVGAIGFTIEISKVGKNIQGIGNFVLGIVFVSIWFALYLFFHLWYINIIGFIFLVFGSYGLFRGLFEMIYSIRQSIKMGGNKKSSMFADIVLLMTEILGLSLVVVQILQQIKVIPS